MWKLYYIRKGLWQFDFTHPVLSDQWRPNRWDTVPMDTQQFCMAVLNGEWPAGQDCVGLLHWLNSTVLPKASDHHHKSVWMCMCALVCMRVRRVTKTLTPERTRCRVWNILCLSGTLWDFSSLFKAHTHARAHAYTRVRKHTHLPSCLSLQSGSVWVHQPSELRGEGRTGRRCCENCENKNNSHLEKQTGGVAEATLRPVPFHGVPDKPFYLLQQGIPLWRFVHCLLSCISNTTPWV